MAMMLFNLLCAHHGHDALLYTLHTQWWRSWLLLLRGYKHDLVVGSIPGPPTPQLWFHPPIKGYLLLGRVVWVKC